MSCVFLGGFPRAGSTLFSALLRQNPQVDVTPTGFLINLVHQLNQGWTNTQSRKAWLDQDDARDRFNRAVKGAIEGYLDRAPVNIEKGRNALAYFETLEAAYGEPPKIIYLIRDLRGIVTSMEKLWRQNPQHAKFGSSNVQNRAAHYLEGPNAPLGMFVDQLQDGLHRRVTDHVLILRFEDWGADPEWGLRQVYDYLDHPYPEGVHDWNCIHDTNREHDAVYGLPADHTITNGAVTPPSEDWDRYLGPGTSRQIIQDHRWFYQTFYPERLG